MKYKTSKSAAVAPAHKEKLETLKTRMISVPILANNNVQGFLVTRIEFVADVDMIKSRQVPAESFVADEAFKIVY
ncbi:MAG: flagellar basal body-associated protein FliL, partial [Hyphomicrobium sp.]